MLNPVGHLTIIDHRVERYVYGARRLKLSFLEWGRNNNPVLILLHGGLESARSWDRLASRMCRDWRIIVPDLRGHGDSDWALGGAYGVLDYVSDIAALLHLLKIDRTAIAGHSLGGAVALQLAALYPERVERVCAIEGLRPVPQSRIDEENERIAELRRWCDDLVNLNDRSERVYLDVEAAAAHLQASDPRMPPGTAYHAALTNTRSTDGGICWKYDLQLRQFTSIERTAPEPSAFWKLVRCPTLLVYGAESWAVNPEKDGRGSYFANAEVVTVPDAGHNVQHHQPDIFHELLTGFLSR